MKKIPEVKNDFKGLYDKLLTGQEANLFLAAIERKIFRELSDWKSPGELAENLCLDPKNTGVFLNSLASLDLIEKKNGRFRNLPTAEEFLAEKNDVYLGDFFCPAPGGTPCRPVRSATLSEAVRWRGAGRR